MSHDEVITNGALDPEGCWWVKVDGKPVGSFYGKRSGAVAAGEAKATDGVVTTHAIGYPTRPRLDDRDNWGPDGCPSFCIAPERCHDKSGKRTSAGCVNPYGRSCVS